jgi:hypothetical protein
VPEPIITISLLLSAAAGGVAEALVGRATDKTPNLVSRAHALLNQTQANDFRAEQRNSAPKCVQGAQLCNLPGFRAEQKMTHPYRCVI